MRESTIEKAFCATVKNFGGIAYKFISPNRVGVPDRLCLFPVPKEHRELVARYVRFAELKKPNGKLRPGQVRERSRIQQMGFTVDIVDTK